MFSIRAQLLKSRVKGGLVFESSPIRLPLVSDTPNATEITTLNFFYSNAQSIKNKLSDLHDILYSFAFKVILFSETWLIPNLSNAMLDPRGLYSIFRKDRDNRFGGGVCIFICNDTDKNCT